MGDSLRAAAGEEKFAGLRRVTGNTFQTGVGRLAGDYQPEAGLIANSFSGGL